jgi:thioredoxin reductase
MSNTVVDYLIIGAGPAGLQLAYYLEKAGRDYLVLEKGETAGTFFRQFPRHRTLISSNKVHTGYSEPERRLRFDWNSLLTDDFSHLFGSYTKKYFAPADTLVRYLADFANKYVPRIRYGVEVKRIERADTFRVIDARGTVYHARRLIVAAGVTKPFVPNIPGVEHAERYTEVSVDPEHFVDQRVLILGKGNSAFETADNLIETAAVIHLASPHPVHFAWNTHFPGHLRAVNNNFLDTYQLKSQNAVLDGMVQEIVRQPDGKLRVHMRYSHAEGEEETIVYDRVILCTGFRFDATIFADSCRPALTIDDRFPSQTSAWESTNVKDLYFAGMITQVRDFKKTNSAFIHGFRYNVRTLSRLLEQRYEGQALPSTPVEASVAGLTQAVITRLNTSSALWQQFGFLCDAIIFDWPGHARLYEELPVDYLPDSEFGRCEYYTVTLEFRPYHGDPFGRKREPRPERADQSVFLHPVIRHYARGALVREFHLLENLFGEWEMEELHIAPLRRFFEEQLKSTASVPSLQKVAVEAGSASLRGPTETP